MKVVLLLCVLVFLPSLLLAAPEVCPARKQCMMTEGASCSATNQVCDFTMYCDSSKKCRNRIPLGGACVANDNDAAPCIQYPSRQTPSVGCINGVCAFTGRMKGAPCTIDSECRGSDKCINGACEGLKLGESCPGALTCGKGLYCNQTSRGVGSLTCIPQRQQGESCWIGAINACAEGLYCVNNDTKNEVLSVCLPFGSRPLGGVCGESKACEPGLYCTGGVNSPGKCARPTYVATNATCDPYSSNSCGKSPDARCMCISDYPKSVCTGPEIYTPEEISDIPYFMVCALSKPDCYGNRFKCDCDPQYLWNWANRMTQDAYWSCDKTLYEFLSKGPPSSTTARPTAGPTPRPTPASTASTAATSASSAATTRTSSTSASSTTSSPTTRSATTTSSPTTRSPTTTSASTSSPSPTGSPSATSAPSATTDSLTSAPTTTTSSPTSAPTTSSPPASTIDVGQSSGSMVVASVLSALLVSLVCLA